MTSVVDRRRFLVTSLAGAIAGPLGAEAQPAERSGVSGFWILDSRPRMPHGRKRLSQNGYIILVT